MENVENERKRSPQRIYWREFEILEDTSIAELEARIAEIKDILSRSDIDEEKRISLENDLKKLFKLSPDSLIIKYALIKWVRDARGEMMLRLEFHAFKDVISLFEIFKYLKNTFGEEINNKSIYMAELTKSNLKNIFLSCPMENIPKTIAEIKILLEWNVKYQEFLDWLQKLYEYRISEEIKNIKEKLEQWDIKDTEERKKLNNQYRELIKLAPDRFLVNVFGSDDKKRSEMLNRLANQSFTDIKAIFDIYKNLAYHYINLPSKYYIIWILAKANLYKIWKICPIEKIIKFKNSLDTNKIIENFIEILQDILNKREQVNLYWVEYVYWLTEWEWQVLEIKQQLSNCNDQKQREILNKTLKELIIKRYS